MRQTIASSLDNRLLYVNSAIVDLGNRMIFDQIVSNVFLFKTDEAKPSGRASVDILKDDGIHDLTKLVEVFFELLVSQLEVEATYKDLGLRVTEFDVSLVLHCLLGIFRLADNVRVWFLYLLARSRGNGLISLVGLQAILSCISFLVVVS